MTKRLPKEYLLESPARYDEVKVMQHCVSLLKTYGSTHLYYQATPFIGVVDRGEHEKTLNNIFKYLMDTHSYSEFEFLRRDLAQALYEAGFFA